MSIPERWNLAAMAFLVVVFGLLGLATGSSAQPVQTDWLERVTTPGSARAVLDQYCVRCHNGKRRTAGLSLDADTLDVTVPGAHPDIWERVVAKLQAGSMPPPGLPRPNGITYSTLTKVARIRTRPNLGGRSQPGPSCSSPSPQSNRVQQRDSRSTRGRP